MSFSEKILEFNNSLSLDGIRLPKDIEVLNPFSSEEIQRITKQFYTNYYNDNNPRRLILGINPGRFGAGVTGIPFTDPKRLQSELKIPYAGKILHEPSSVFVYKVIEAYGGPQKFYGDFYISAVCPLGFVKLKNNKPLNYNYYDSPELFSAVKNYIVETLRKTIAMGVRTDNVIVFGTGKNKEAFEKLNAEYKLFGSVDFVEHPRFIMQYKKKEEESFVSKYLNVLHQ